MPPDVAYLCNALECARDRCFIVVVPEVYGQNGGVWVFQLKFKGLGEGDVMSFVGVGTAYY